MAKITFNDGGAYFCGTAVSAPKGAEIDFTNFDIVACGKGVDLADKPKTSRKTNNDADEKWHAKPLGVLALGVATMLGGTAISRLMGF